MYSDPDHRAAEIEESAAKPDSTLRAEATTTADDLAAALNALTAEQWQVQVRSALGRAIPAAEIPWMRIREVWLHAIDPGTAVEIGEPPAGVVDLLLDDVTGALSRKEGCASVTLAPVDRPGTWTLGDGTDPQTLQAPAAELAGWPTGRLPRAGWPVLPPWLCGNRSTEMRSHDNDHRGRGARTPHTAESGAARTRRLAGQRGSRPDGRDRGVPHRRDRAGRRLPHALTADDGSPVSSHFFGQSAFGTHANIGSAGRLYQDRYWHDREFSTVENLRALAAEAGMSLTTLAMAWVLANPAITAPIVGASRPAQLADNLAAVDVTLEPDFKARLDELTAEYRRRDAVR